MTRFWITLRQAVDFVLVRARAHGGRRGVRAQDPVDAGRSTWRAAIAPDVPHELIGIRPGEKLHEVLITPDEARHAIDAGEVFVVLPEHSWWDAKGSNIMGRPVEDGFSYSSDNNPEWITVDELRELLPTA